jgi:hypothetical protein
LAVNHEGAEILACDERIHFEQQINWQNFGRVALRCKKNFLELLIIPLACLPGVDKISRVFVDQSVNYCLRLSP